MKIFKCLLVLFVVSIISFSTSLINANELTKGEEYESAALSPSLRPILGAYVKSDGTLMFTLYGMGPSNNNATGISLRIRDASGWTSSVTNFTSNPCGSDLIEIPAPKKVTGEFGVQVTFTDGDGYIFTRNYGVISGNNTVNYGKWTLTGNGFIGIIQNEFTYDSFTANPNTPVSMNAQTFDAIGVFAKVNTSLSLTNIYGNALYEGASAYTERYNSCDYLGTAEVSNTGNFASFSSKTVNYFEVIGDYYTPMPDFELNSASFLNYSQKVCVNIKNNGTTATTKTTTLEFYADFDDPQPYFGLKPIGVVTIPSGFQPGSAYAKDFCYTTNLTVTHTFGISFDRYNTIYETKDTVYGSAYRGKRVFTFTSPTPSPTPITQPTINKVSVYRFYNARPKLISLQ